VLGGEDMVLEPPEDAEIVDRPTRPPQEEIPFPGNHGLTMIRAVRKTHLRRRKVPHEERYVSVYRVEYMCSVGNDLYWANNDDIDISSRLIFQLTKAPTLILQGTGFLRI